MIKKLIVSFLILLLFNITSHAQESILLQKIALLPADVRIIGNTEKLAPEKIYQAELTTGFKFQAEMYSWFLKNYRKFKNSFEIQNIEMTNNLIFSGGISLNQYRNLARDSIAKILNVDAVIFCSSTIERSIKGFDPLPILSFLLDRSLLGAVNAIPLSNSEVHKLFITLEINKINSLIPIWRQKYGHYNNGIYNLQDILKRILKDASHHFPITKK